MHGAGPKSGPKFHKEETVNAAELERQNYPPLQEAVEGVFPFGQLAVIGGHTGVRKSWTVNELALALVEGPLGSGWMGLFQVPRQTPVLLIANEDNYPRIQSRLRQIRAGRPALELPADLAKRVQQEPDVAKRSKLEARLRKQVEKETYQKLDVRVKFPSYEEGGLEEIRAWIDNENQPCVVILDVMANFREAVGSFRRDRRMISEIGKFSHDTGALMVAVMHMYKGVIREGSNWTDKLVGSGGVGAATDVKFGINAVEGASEGRLLLYGKDIPNQAYKLELTESGVWKAGSDEEIIVGKHGREISEQRKLLLKVVTENQGRTPLQIWEIRPTGPDGRKWEANTVKQTLYQMWRKAKPPQLINEAGGYYTPEFIKNRDENQVEMWTPSSVPVERLNQANPFHVVH